VIRARPTVAEVDLDAVRHNVRAMKPDRAQLMAVVKADGYGHGATEVARAALEAGATWLGVATVEEALALRESGLRAPILVLSELSRGSESEALAGGITPTLYTEDGLRWLSSAARSLDLTPGVHVKVDTGMHRVGLFPPDRAVEFVTGAVAAQCAFEGLWTHLARAEEDTATTEAQLRRFRRSSDDLAAAGLTPSYRHAANSAATIRHPESHFDLVRVGIALYGLDPGGGLGDRAGLRPALRWRTAVTQVKRLPTGEAVSYGHRYRLERDTTVATIPVGYADGYRRGLSSRADVLIGGRRRRVAGTVTMDQTLVDCGDDPVQAGDEVVLIGRQGDQEVTADELARILATIGYEVVCGIGPRVPRVFVGEQDQEPTPTRNGGAPS